MLCQQSPVGGVCRGDRCVMFKVVTDSPSMQNRLYVGNLTQDVAASTLQELFEPFGFVMDVKLGENGGAEPAPRSALVTMATDEAAGAARLALDGSRLHGVSIRVEPAEAVEPMGHSGGQS